MVYGNIVRRDLNKPGTKPVKEINSGLTFTSAYKAAQHFKINSCTVREYANGRKKKPTLPYVFQWVQPDEKN